MAFPLKTEIRLWYSFSPLPNKIKEEKKNQMEKSGKKKVKRFLYVGNKIG